MSLIHYQREFDALRYLTSGELVEVPETKYLHSMLKTGPRPLPVFNREKFRVPADRNSPQDDPPKIDKQPDQLLRDPELRVIVEHIFRLRRVISELEVAKKIIREAGVRDVRHTDEE